jgi:hypothetical protein
MRDGRRPHGGNLVPRSSYPESLPYSVRFDYEDEDEDDSRGYAAA